MLHSTYPSGQLTACIKSNTAGCISISVALYFEIRFYTLGRKYTQKPRRNLQRLVLPVFSLSPHNFVHFAKWFVHPVANIGEKIKYGQNSRSVCDEVYGLVTEAEPTGFSWPPIF